MENPLVSIIIPVYNAFPYLRKCIDSVLCQTYTNIEVVCVNDGSTDNSIEILRDYVSQDSRVILIDIENQGVSNARNVAMGNANGQWLLFVDADDWLEPNCVEYLLNYGKKSNCDIVMFPYVRERGGVSLKKSLFEESKVFTDVETKQLARRMIGPIGKEITTPAFLDSYGTVWGKLYHRRTIDGLKFVDLSVIGSAEDSLFNMFAFKNAKTVAYYEGVYYHYRRDNKLSLTSGTKPNLKEKWKSLYGIVSSNFHSEEEKQALSNRIALGILGLLINAYASGNTSKKFKAILNDEMIHEAIASFDTKGLSFHWQLFYYFAKNKNVLAIMFLITIIQIIRFRL